MINNRASTYYYPELPVGTKVYCNINKKTYEKIYIDGDLSKWKSENGATLLSTDEHMYNKKCFKFLNEGEITQEDQKAQKSL